MARVPIVGVSIFLLFACGATGAGSFAPETSAEGGDAAAPIADASTSADVTASDAAMKKESGARKDAGASSSITKCEQGASCTGTERCAENDGTTYHYCMCSADKLGCGDIQASPPNTCVEGGACSSEGSTCATDDGTTASYCRCKSSAWKCSSLTMPTASCSVAGNTCSFITAGNEPEWLGCFSRNLGSVQGVVCHTTSGGWGANGVLFTPSCPKDAPHVATACSASGSLFCGCEDPITNERCVCSCPGGTWQCMH